MKTRGEEGGAIGEEGGAIGEEGGSLMGTKLAILASVSQSGTGIKTPAPQSSSSIPLRICFLARSQDRAITPCLSVLLPLASGSCSVSLPLDPFLL